MPRPRICDDESAARRFLEKLRWPRGPACPHCGCSDSSGARPIRLSPRLLHCPACRRQYSVTVGTIFSSSHIPLHKWLRALRLLCGRGPGVTAAALQQELELGTYSSAWAMSHRIRWALTQPPLAKLLKAPVPGPRQPLRIVLPFRVVAQALFAVQPEPRIAPRGDRAAGAKPSSKKTRKSRSR